MPRPPRSPTRYTWEELAQRVSLLWIASSGQPTFREHVASDVGTSGKIYPMQIEFAFLGRDAAIAQGTFFVRGGGVNQIQAADFPTRVPVLHLITQIVLSPAECGHEHDLAIQVADPDGNVTEQEVPIKFTRPPRPDRPTKPASLILVADLSDLVYPVPGDYEVRVLIDGHYLASVCLEVTQISPGEDEGD